MTTENKFKWLGLFIVLVVPAIVMGMTSALSLTTLLKEQINNFPTDLYHFWLFLFSHFYWLLFFILLLIIRFGEKESFNSLGSLRMNSGTLGVSAGIIISAIGVVILVALILISVFHLHIPRESMADRIVQLPLWKKALSALGAGIIEETFYRGYAITRLQQLTKNKPASIIIPLVIFALLHGLFGNVHHMVFALTGGIVLTIFYVKYKNLLANMIGHALFDFLFLAIAR